MVRSIACFAARVVAAQVISLAALTVVGLLIRGYEGTKADIDAKKDGTAAA